MMRRQYRPGSDDHSINLGDDNPAARAENGGFQLFQLQPVAAFDGEIFLDPVEVEVDESLPVLRLIEASGQGHFQIVYGMPDGWVKFASFGQSCQ